MPSESEIVVLLFICLSEVKVSRFQKYTRICFSPPLPHPRRENACCPKGCNPVYDECIPDVKRSPPPSPPPSPIDTPSAQYAHPSCFPAFQNIPGSDKPKLTGVEGIPFNVEGGLRRVSTNRYCFTVAAKGDCENELSGSRGVSA